MPKERLQTKWNPETQNWEVFLSMENNSLNRGTIDLVKVINRKYGAQHIRSLEETDKIRDYLQDDLTYKKVQKQLDDNRRAIYKGKQQTPEAGYYYQATSTILGSTLFPTLCAAIVDLGFKATQNDDNKALSFEDLLKQSIATFVIYTAFSGALTATNYLYFRKKHHALMDDNNAHKTNDELLGRLDKIRDEVNLKNAVLEKIDAFFGLSEADNLNNDEKNFRNAIIAGLDKNDNIEDWKSVNQNLDIDVYWNGIKREFIEQYKYKKEDLEGAVSQINNFPELLAYVDNNMSNEKKEYVGIKLPREFIITSAVQILQKKESKQQYSISENINRSHNNNTDDKTLSEVGQGSSSNNNPHVFLGIEENTPLKEIENTH